MGDELETARTPRSICTICPIFSSSDIDRSNLSTSVPSPEAARAGCADTIETMANAVKRTRFISVAWDFPGEFAVPVFSRKLFLEGLPEYVSGQPEAEHHP